MEPTQRTVGGTIVFVTSKMIFVLGSDYNLYRVDFELKKGLKNPLFKEGLCVEVLYMSPDSFKIGDVLVIVPVGETNGKVGELSVL